jgi:hypothetical protein
MMLQIFLSEASEIRKTVASPAFCALRAYNANAFALGTLYTGPFKGKHRRF